MPMVNFPLSRAMSVNIGSSGGSKLHFAAVVFVGAAAVLWANANAKIVAYNERAMLAPRM